MIIGMLPMALGLGEGGEQNAPLDRAVVGGLHFCYWSQRWSSFLLSSSILHSQRAKSPATASGELHAA